MYIYANQSIGIYIIFNVILKQRKLLTSSN